MKPSLVELVVLTLPLGSSKASQECLRRTQGVCLDTARKIRTLLGAHLEVTDSRQQGRRLVSAQLAATYRHLASPTGFRPVT